MMAANTPAVSKVGVTPIISAPSAIPPTVVSSTALRPTRSAIQPKNKPPIGRKMKPTAKMAMAPRMEATGSDGLKISRAK